MRNNSNLLHVPDNSVKGIGLDGQFILINFSISDNAYQTVEWILWKIKIVPV